MDFLFDLFESKKDKRSEPYEDESHPSLEAKHTTQKKRFGDEIDEEFLNLFHSDLVSILQDDNNPLDTYLSLEINYLDQDDQSDLAGAGDAAEENILEENHGE